MGNLDIARLRLLNQRIEGERCANPEDVVRRLGAMQGQDYAQSLWAVGLRTTGASAAHVEQAISTGAIVRTWLLRGTIHLVAPENVSWILKLCAPRAIASTRRRRDELGLDSETATKSFELFSRALQGGNCLSRAEMLTLLESNQIPTSGQRGYHILWFAAMNGLICFGPPNGKEQTFVLLDEWAAQGPFLPREEFLAELAFRYMSSHGPATAHDLAWWAGITVADAKAAIAAAQPRLYSQKVGEIEYWMADSPGAGRSDDEPRIHLLPGFDEYLLGYKERNRVLHPDHAEKVVPGRNGVFLPIVVEAGRVVGVWRRTIKEASVDVEVSPFEQLGASKEALATIARRYGAFLGTPSTEVTLSSP